MIEISVYFNVNHQHSFLIDFWSLYKLFLQVCGAAKIKGCLKGPKGSRGRPGNYGGRGAPGPRVSQTLH